MIVARKKAGKFSLHIESVLRVLTQVEFIPGSSLGEKLKQISEKHSSTTSHTKFLFRNKYQLNAIGNESAAFLRMKVGKTNILMFYSKRNCDFSKIVKGQFLDDRVITYFILSDRTQKFRILLSVMHDSIRNAHEYNSDMR